MNTETPFTAALLDHIDEQQSGNKPLLFRCHNAGGMLTDPKTKADKEAGNLSETSKSLIRDMWLQNKYGYREIVTTDAMTKGLTLEQDSLDLVDKAFPGAFRAKNRELYRNDYLIGTPDTKAGDTVEDIKTCWTLKTFFDAEPSKMNEVQIQCYMALMGLKKGRVIFTLLPTSEQGIISQCERAKWAYGGDYENEDYIRHCEQIRHNNAVINTIPIKDRVKVFEYGYDAAMIEKLYGRIEVGREYYKTLKL